MAGLVACVEKIISWVGFWMDSVNFTHCRRTIILQSHAEKLRHIPREPARQVTGEDRIQATMLLL